MKKLFPYILWLSYVFFIIGCRRHDIRIADSVIAHKWAEMTLFILKNTPSNSPTFASRSLGYIGLTMYEAIQPGYSEYQSLENQLNNLSKLPKPFSNKEYHWPSSLNAAQAFILKNIYIQTSDENKLKIDSLESWIDNYYENFEKKNVIQYSKSFGRSIADSIFQWSKSDGGHRGYLNNFDKNLVNPVFEGGWKPPLYGQSISHYPLHPYWGNNRTFSNMNAQMDTPIMKKFSIEKNSEYYNLFKEVVDKEKNLTKEEKEIAVWWGDDPDFTFTPPGHSYYLTMTLLKKENSSMIDCAMLYAKVGLAVADAFINCWKWKYLFFTERPNTFVTERLNPTWESFWPDPPFPAFPSGHAIQAAAALEVWLSFFNNQTPIIDSAHYGRKKDGLRKTEFIPRPFDSLSQIAQEVADSRFYGGIHTRYDNEIGLKEGKKIGKNINSLHWKK